MAAQQIVGILKSVNSLHSAQKKAYLGLHIIVDILKSTESLHSVLLLIVNKNGEKRKIKFRNGSSVFVNYAGYLSIKRLILLGYTVKQIDENFRVYGPKFDLTMNYSELLNIALVAGYPAVCKIRRLGEDLFDIQCKDYTLQGSIGLMGFLYELSLGVFDCEFKGKIVLDVGGFQGESAVLFSDMYGCKEGCNL